MTWMLTASGEAFDLRFIAQDSIKLDDIAHHLAQINRYTGACSRPYSVAEHSLLVLRLTESQGESDPNVRMAALMHDAHEAYTNDLSSPMKHMVGQAWQQVEWRVQQAVLRRFNLLTAFSGAEQRIHWADMTALMTERDQLLPPGGPAWTASHRYSASPHVELRRDDRPWTHWRDAFAAKFNALTGERAARAATLAKGGCVGDQMACCGTSPCTWALDCVGQEAP